MKDIPKSLIKTEPTLSWQAVNVQATNKDVWKALKAAFTVSEKERDFLQEKVRMSSVNGCRLASCGAKTTIQSAH